VILSFRLIARDIMWSHDHVPQQKRISTFGQFSLKRE